MKNILLFLIIIFFFNCNDKKKENMYERDKRLISEYHKKMIEDKGDSTFFIYSYEIRSIFHERKEVSKDEIEIGDNVCFCDTLGNIRYQAVVKNIENGKIYINCLNLSKIEYYVTELNFDSIRDLKKGYPYKLRFFR